ncbi:unnamed protein product [Symbiodinium necroappetens]|uniref:Uncharacterized protein n=1 Tax=Symbiodinium necroappetens TaxID=1628268 RepID=A0A812QKD3_9DINO|nr:unnamed protein product [Symbiodinium necroappetens]
MLDQFWVFAKAAETVFSESLGYQMGFGRCEKIPRQRDAKSIAQFQRDLAIRALAAPYAVELDGLRADGDPVFADGSHMGVLSDEYPGALAMAMEKYVAEDQMPNPTRIFMWWTLCMIFASQRFDDHVKPHELEVKPEGLFGEAGASQEALQKVTAFTWHSARVTMLDQAVHCKRTEQEIGVQANWKNPGPLVLKYTRSRSSLPALMIKDLVSEVSKEYEPECAREDDAIDDHEDRGDCLTEFFIKVAPEKGTSYEYKFHVCSAESIEEIACKREITSEFVHIGSVLPDPKCLCERSLVGSHRIVVMVDRTVYPDKDKVPELALRQIFGRQKLLEDLCFLLADKGMLSVERVAMLGDTITSVKATIKAIVGDDAKFGPDEPARELSLTLLAAVWKSTSTLQEHVATRRAKMEEDPSKIPEIPGEDHAEFREIFVNQHPDVILTYMREPQRKFVERIHRDYMVHGAVAFYEVAEMRSRSDQIVSTSGFSKTSDDLLRVVQHDNKISVTSEGSVMDRLHAFFVELEYLNICEFTMEAGPLKYLSELEEWRHENRGLSLLLSADSLLRKKVYKLSNDKRKDLPTFSSALKEVLKNHKQLWKDARSTAELDKFKQVEHDPTSTKRARSTSPPPPPTPTSEARTKKNRDKDKDKSGKPSGGAKLTARADRDPRISEKEWKKIMSFTYTGAALSATTCEARFQKLISADLGSAPPWSAWSQVPTDPYLVRYLGHRCLELFAGSGVFTAHLRQRGLRVLPPIDILRSPEVAEQQDLLDGDFFEQLLLLACMGAIGFLHVGLPCSTSSQARQRPGGPRPQLNELLSRSLLLMQSVITAGGDFSLENPLSSLVWQVPSVQQLKVRHHLYNVDLDQCEFGGASKKSTRLLVSNALFLQLARACSGDRLHVPLKGKVRGPDGRLIFATKPAQIYPVGLVVAWSAVVEQILQGILPQFAKSFDLVTEARRVCSLARSSTRASCSPCSSSSEAPRSRCSRSSLNQG